MGHAAPSCLSPLISELDAVVSAMANLPERNEAKAPPVLGQSFPAWPVRGHMGILLGQEGFVHLWIICVCISARAEVGPLHEAGPGCYGG